MKTQRMPAIVFLLVVSSLAFGQIPQTKTAEADRMWPAFWSQINAALNKKDSVALRKLMAKNFSDDSGGLSGAEWLKLINKNARKGSWRDLRKSFATGTVVNREWSAKGILTRVTKDEHYYFEFRKDKRWYFAGVVGD